MSAIRVEQMSKIIGERHPNAVFASTNTCDQRKIYGLLRF